MNRHTDIQIIRDPGGEPAFVVLPYTEWLSQYEAKQHLVPNEVVNHVFDQQVTPMRAWREYLALTQTEVARRIGISQAAYAQMETTASPRRSTLTKVAKAFDITVEQLDF